MSEVDKALNDLIAIVESAIGGQALGVAFAIKDLVNAMIEAAIDKATKE